MTQPEIPAVSDFGSLSIPPVTIVDFAPGVTLHLLDNGSCEANRVSVYLSRGTAATDCAGAPAIMPALLREGCATMSGADIAETIDFNGAFITAIAQPHFSGLSLISLNETTRELLPLVGDMLLTPAFPDKAVENALRKVVMDRRLNLTKPSYIASQAIATAMKGKAHPYMLPTPLPVIEGTCRDDIVRAHSLARQTPVHIFAAGRLSDKIVNAVEELATRLKPEDTSATVAVVPLTPGIPSDSIIDSATAAMQGAVACGIPAIGRNHPDYDELRHTVVALGGYFGSRLMTSIREEKGLTYGISAALFGSQEGAFVQISAQCDNAYSAQVVDEIRHELRRLATEPMPDDQLRRVRADITSGLAARLDSPFSLIDYYETNLMVGIGDGYFERQFDTISRLTPQRLMHIAAKYLDPGRLSTVVVRKQP